VPSPQRHSGRRSIRLPGRDYRQPAWLFVTICAQGKACLFGRVVYGAMRLNAAGRMLRTEWERLGARFESVEPREFVVMPNHVHGILAFRAWGAVGLGGVLAAFKSCTTVAYIRGVRAHGWGSFDRRLWQRNYWERVLRDEDEVMHARAYIESNPAQWERDRLHPESDGWHADGGRGEWWAPDPPV
jgi:putative transposase